MVMPCQKAYFNPHFSKFSGKTCPWTPRGDTPMALIKYVDPLPTIMDLLMPTFDEKLKKTEKQEPSKSQVRGM